jgi:hypothetical protein
MTNNTEFRFYYTVVHKFNTFWIRQESQTVLYRSGAGVLAAHVAVVLAGLLLAQGVHRMSA